MRIKLIFLLLFSIVNTAFAEGLKFFDDLCGRWYDTTFKPIHVGEDYKYAYENFNVVEFQKVGDSILRTQYLLEGDSNDGYCFMPNDFFLFTIIDFDKYFNLYLSTIVSLNPYSDAPALPTVTVSILKNSSMCEIDIDPYIPLTMNEETMSKFRESMFLNGDILNMDFSKNPIVDNKFLDDKYKMRGLYSFKRVVTDPKILSLFNEGKMRDALLTYKDSHKNVTNEGKLLKTSAFLKKFGGEWHFQGKRGYTPASECYAKFFNENILLFNFSPNKVGLFWHIYFTARDYNISDASTDLHLSGLIKIKNKLAKDGIPSRWDDPKNVILNKSGYFVIKSFCVLYYNTVKYELTMARFDILLEETKDGLNRKYNRSQYFSEVPDDEDWNGEIIWKPYVPRRAIVRVPEIYENLKWEISKDFTEIKEFYDNEGEWSLAWTMRKLVEPSSQNGNKETK